MLEELGVRRVVNAAGTLTLLGGSTIDGEVLKAIEEAAKVYLDMPQLHIKAGEYLAKLTGAEAAYITSGAAAGLVLSMAACMTLGDTSKMTQLPKTQGMKNEAIVQKLHRNMYDYNLELAGAKIVEIGDEKKTEAYDLRKAVNMKTAAVVYFAFGNQEGVLPLERVIEIAHELGVPVIVDAAAELPPAENLTKFVKMGADLVLFSGGKDLGGLNDSGLILGRKNLVQVCMRLGPHSYENVDSEVRVFIGRPMKVSKEGIVGLVAAVKRYLVTDHDKRIEQWGKKVEYMISRLSACEGVKVRKVVPTSIGHRSPDCIPVLEIEPLTSRVNVDALNEELANGKPSIRAYIAEAKLYVNPHCLQEGDEKLVASRLEEILSSMSRITM